MVSGPGQAWAGVTQPSPGARQVLMEKEPQDTLCTSTRQQTLCIISSLW